MNPLPDLLQAPLDEQSLADLFQDIATFGKDIEVIPKRQARQQVGNQSITLEEAYLALRERAMPAAQIRYTHEEQDWCDTLVLDLKGWRLTRINLTQATTRNIA